MNTRHGQNWLHTTMLGVELMSNHMLTTIDNPYNPFTNFDEWFQFDEERGYHTCSYLARIAKTSDEFSDEENSYEIEAAIDEIVNMDPFGIYIKVAENTEIK